MNKNKEKNKATLRSSIILLFLIAILLISSTYAWFTANRTVTISTIDVNVAASNGIQISTNGTDWKALITNEDITTYAYAGNVNQFPASMVPVSSAGEIDSSTGYMNMYYGVVEANGNGINALTASQETDAAGTTGKYVAFDVFLRVDADSDLYMTTESNVVFKSTAQQTTDIFGLKNAARVAFCVEGNVAAGSTVGQMSALKGAVSHGATGSTVYIWEPNYDVHTSAGVAAANDTYGITTSVGPNASAISYFGVKDDIESPIILSQTYTYTYDNEGTPAQANPDANYFKAVTTDYKTKETQPTYTQVFRLASGITKVRIYMWVEGQDVDCENNASGSNISFNVQLSLNSEPPTTTQAAATPTPTP